MQQIRARFQPTLSQHPPIPLHLPNHYANTRLPAIASLPIVSIMTPSLNQGQFLERTIQSVLTQNYPKLEYIIQDGLSTDSTDDILEKYHSVLMRVDSGKDSGQAQAINRGFRQTNGDILAWLNADDLLLPGTIPFLVKFFIAHPEIDVVYGYRICIDEQDREIGRWIVAPSAESVLPWANYIPQETLFWRRRIWEKVGRYVDESYQFAMDWDLLLRFYKAGATFARIPMFLGAFRVHTKQKTKAWDAIGQEERKRLHQQYHGRPVEWLEVRYHVKRYLTRTAWLYLLFYLGLLPH